ncbi:hypothetical protein HG530_002206 [Fusarium avenaceum]|nr:hypothetical protein HG530_002206 [Fusarium avenaceum]
MSSTSRIPHLLEPYLALPSEGSLSLVTSVLGASSNWLVLRHVYSYLRGTADGDESAKDTGVVLVSFMRDDGLTGLYSDASPQAPGARKERFLTSTSPADIKKEIEGALGDLRASRKVLIIDQLDTLLAVTDESTTSLTLQNLVLSLRSLVHSTVLTLSADTPLVAAQATALERENASLVLSTAHVADAVLALRPGVEGMGGATEYLYHVVADGGVKSQQQAFTSTLA